MPKHGWKWRTEQLRSLTPEQLHLMLSRHHQKHVSAKLARWIYRNLLTGPEHEDARISAIECIGWDERANWIRPFLWGELERHKGDLLGDWIVVALTRPGAWAARDAERFIDLYQDETAHPLTRGSAIFGLSSSLFLARCYASGVSRGVYQLPAETWERARSTCAKAFADENPYARAGAGWLAKPLGGFEPELARVADDHTEIWPGSGLTVADHVG